MTAHPTHVIMVDYVQMEPIDMTVNVLLGIPVLTVKMVCTQIFVDSSQKPDIFLTKYFKIGVYFAKI